MNKKIIFISLFFISLFCWAGCSDDDGNGDSGGDFFPDKLGSYWLGENYELDSLNNILEDDIPVKDSMVIEGNENLLGRESFTMASYELIADNYFRSGEIKFAKEEQIIYAHSSMITGFMPDNFPVELPIEIEEQWMVFIDRQSSMWMVFEQDFVDTIDGGPFGEIIIKGTMEVTGRKAGTEELEIMGGGLKTNKYTLEFKLVNTTVTISSIPVPFPLERKMHIWLAEDIGMVKQVMESTVIELSMIGAQQLSGSLWQLYDYNIAGK